MNTIIFLYKDGSSRTFENVEPFHNNIGQLMCNESNDIAYVIIAVGEHNQMEYMPELLNEKNLDNYIGYGITLENTDSDDMVKFKLLTYNIIKDFYKFQFNIS